MIDWLIWLMIKTLPTEEMFPPSQYCSFHKILLTSSWLIFALSEHHQADSQIYLPPLYVLSTLREAETGCVYVFMQKYDENQQTTVCNSWTRGWIDLWFY